MTWSVSPSLALYLKHPNDIFDLIAVDAEGAGEPPEGVEKDDWSKFHDVAIRLGEIVGKLCVDARQCGIEALKATHQKKSQSNAKSAATEWFAWAEMQRIKAPPSARLYIGAGVGHREKSVFLVPYVAPISTLGVTTEELLAGLRRAVPDAAIYEWFDSTTIALALHPITPVTDLDELVRKCGATFERLGAQHKSLP
jgi:hypothetical protein